MPGVSKEAQRCLLAVTSDPAVKGLAKGVEVASAGPVHCYFSLLPSFLTMCSFKRCPSFVSPWYIDHLNYMHVLAITSAL